MKLTWTTALALLITTLLGCRGKVNPYDIVNASFTKVGVHEHGEKYIYHNNEINHSYYLLKVKGNLYQAGLAYGALMKD
jgi:hypothetical protein